jgi:hypothetical protein
MFTVICHCETYTTTVRYADLKEDAFTVFWEKTEKLKYFEVQDKLKFRYDLPIQEENYNLMKHLRGHSMKSKHIRK